MILEVSNSSGSGGKSGTIQVFMDQDLDLSGGMPCSERIDRLNITR